MVETVIKPKTILEQTLYTPQLVRIEKIIQETPDVKTFKLVFEDPELREKFTFKAGQFGEYSVFGVGESTFCISSSPMEKGYIECSVKLMGKNTTALHDLEEGMFMGFRGPYGNWFPVDEMKGKNIVFIGGGIGLAPVRSIIFYCIHEDNRKDFKDISILAGARSIADHSFKYNLEEWQKRDDIKLVKTVDFDPKDPGWDGEVGFIPAVLEKMAPSPDNAVAVVCGPPIMIKFTCQSLKKLGFTPEQIITTLEMRMKCGLGKCGRCNIGKIYVCKDGPVFKYSEILSFPGDEF